MERARCRLRRRQSDVGDEGPRAVGASPVSGAGADAIARADAIVVPGVGHFSQTARSTQRARDAIRAAIARGVPLLGICLGLQWLFEGSDEAPDVAGLGIFQGRCFDLGSAGSDPTQGAACRLEHARRASAGLLRDCSTASRRRHSRTSRTRTRRPSSTTPSPRRRTARRSPRSSNAAACSARSFIPRSQATQDCACSPTSSRIARGAR